MADADHPNDTPHRPPIMTQNAAAHLHLFQKFCSCFARPRQIGERYMYMVYWTLDDQQQRTPHAKAFDSSHLREAMLFMEELRSRERAGVGVSFIVMSSENPLPVGL